MSYYQAGLYIVPPRSEVGNICFGWVNFSNLQAQLAGNNFECYHCDSIASGPVNFSNLKARLAGEKYTSGPRYWNVPVLVNTGTFLVYQYCLKMWYLRSLERAGVIQKLTILECKNGLVLSNTCVPASGTWSILFPVTFTYYLPSWLIKQKY